MLLLASPAGAGGQFQALVKRVTAETRDGLRITAWLERQDVTLAQDTTIRYVVENRGGKTVYLVRQRGELETAVSNDGTLQIMVPLPFPEGHGGYDYGFTRVAPRRVYGGRLTFPGKKYDEARRWTIEISFGVVADIEGLDRRLRPDEDPASLRGLLGERIEIVGVNGLTLEVNKP